MKYLLMFSVTCFMLLGAATLITQTTGCTSKNPICDIIKVGVGPIAALAASPEVGKCEDVAALEACLTADLDKTPICKPKPEEINAKGLVGSLVCPRVADSLKNILLKQYCPQAKCTGGDLVGTGRDKFIELCKNVVSF